MNGIPLTDISSTAYSWQVVTEEEKPPTRTYGDVYVVHARVSCITEVKQLLELAFDKAISPALVSGDALRAATSEL